MKRLCMILILVLLLSGCGGLGDWSYDLLPGDYEVWRVNSQDIVLGIRKGSILEHAVEPYISAFAYNDNFIAVQRLNVDDIEIPAGTDIREMGLEPEYWLVDTAAHAVYGPFTAEGYRKQIAALDVGELCGWIDTYPAPAGAK